MRQPATLARLAAPHLLAGARWYTDGRRACRTLGGLARSVGAGDDFRDHADYAAGVVAVVSPRTTVWGGLLQACRWIARGVPPWLPSVAASLRRFESTTGDIAGPKTRAFAAALSGDTSAVVLDVWVLRAIGAPAGSVPRGARYVELADRVRGAALLLDASPAAVQAALWLAVRPPGHPGGHLTPETVRRAWAAVTC